MPDINNVEIMAEGTWNGNKITSETLGEIVAGFEATKDFNRPVLKLGHNNEQKLLAEDGLPSAGWVSNVYIKGKKLFANFVDIPEKIFSLIEKGAYNKVSVELFAGYKFKGESYNNLLGAVAILGADIPAVATLNDILSRYSQSFTFEAEKDTIKNVVTFERSSEETMDTENDNAEVVKGLEEKLAAAEAKNEELGAKVSEFKANKDSIESKFDELKSDTDAKIASLQGERDSATVEKFTLDLEGKDLVSPSMKPFVSALLADGVAAKREFSVGGEKLSTAELLEKIFKLQKEVYSINTVEKTADAKPSEDVDNVTEIGNAIEGRIKEHKESYAVAYKTVMRNLGK